MIHIALDIQKNLEKQFKTTSFKPGACNSTTVCMLIRLLKTWNMLCSSFGESAPNYIYIKCFIPPAQWVEKNNAMKDTNILHTAVRPKMFGGVWLLAAIHNNHKNLVPSLLPKKQRFSKPPILNISGIGSCVKRINWCKGHWFCSTYLVIRMSDVTWIYYWKH